MTALTPVSSTWHQIVERLDDVMLVGLIVLALPVTILLLASPIVAVAWLVAALAR